MKSLLWLVSVVFLIVGPVSVLKLWPTLHPRTVMTAPLSAECHLRQAPCVSRFPNGGTVTLDIQPRNIPPLQPLDLKVTTDKLDANVVDVDFQGVDMNMGYNRTRLSQSAPGVFSGKAVLSVCVRNRMLWEAHVLVHTDEGIAAAPFRFETRRN